MHLKSMLAGLTAALALLALPEIAAASTNPLNEVIAAGHTTALNSMIEAGLPLNADAPDMAQVVLAAGRLYRADPGCRTGLRRHCRTTGRAWRRPQCPYRGWQDRA